MSEECDYIIDVCVEHQDEATKEGCPYCKIEALKKTHTIIDFGCWYCQLRSWLQHRLRRCGAWCSYCIAEADAELTAAADEYINEELDRRKS